jgi:hypothetical protein
MKLTKRQEEKARRKQKLYELFNSECGVCRLPYKPYMFDFHHVVPKLKKFKLSGDNLLRKWKTVLLEAHKCKMVCPNCHRYLHYKMGDNN